MIKTSLTAVRNGKELHSYDGWDGFPVLVTTTHGAQNGHFKSVTNANVDINTIAAPSGKDAIVLTDLIISADKVNGSTTTVRFTDGTNTVNIVVGDSSNAPFSMAIPFAGHWQGWQGARLELVTDTNLQNATASVGYFYILENKAMTFSAWDSAR